MTKMVIHIPGHPVGKGRARSARLPNGKTIHYTPEKTRTWEGIARSIAIDAMQGRTPFEQPLEVEIEIALLAPDSWPEWKRDAALDGSLDPTVKPDADNIEKAVKDAFNGVVWRDDCQIVRDAKRKRYGQKPGVTVVVVPRETMPAQIKRRPR